MNILLVSKKAGRSMAFNLSRQQMLGLALGVFVALPAVALYGGYRLAGGEAQDGRITAALEQEMAQQRGLVDEARRQASADLRALTMRLGQMQAQVTRLDALGERLTSLAELDDGEFDFANPPAQGGPESSVAETPLETPDFLAQLDVLAEQLASRQQQLEVLESMLLSQNLQSEVFPAGKPTDGGWISSKFGYRNDPFTGEREYHKGIDVAAREGSDILAVAGGVITWSGPRHGYGNLVEINHGNGYVTRYGHCKEVFFKVGDTVKKGDAIALLGTTGRSTGPHVHFEVIVDGKRVDPMDYVQAAL